eukprot:CAMPEP_0113696092 /NCGR_PEP_ID=MMETSP0038_2-20120614/21280_1 /TAXON_ID=2898 /ORGANISM="Cryptomonas paramecium" /LENGTH=40 /DNA_ID=CAMNT_0000618741 /DNA_START=476 /DNA_END=598 /DNA_ORIENTATION=- /assembly_acc=CAM_ASM_000170
METTRGVEPVHATEHELVHASGREIVLKGLAVVSHEPLEH